MATPDNDTTTMNDGTTVTHGPGRPTREALLAAQALGWTVANVHTTQWRAVDPSGVARGAPRNGAVYAWAEAAHEAHRARHRAACEASKASEARLSAADRAGLAYLGGDEHALGMGPSEGE